MSRRKPSCPSALPLPLALLLLLLLAQTGLFAEASDQVWDQFRPSRPEYFGGYSYVKVAPDSGGGPPLARNAWFGFSTCNLGDLNGDGVDDLAVRDKCDAMLCCAMLYYAMLCCTVLCYAVLYCAMLCCTMLYYAMLCVLCAMCCVLIYHTLQVGAYGESYRSSYRLVDSKAAGAVYILFMSKNFTVNSYERISGERTGNQSDPLNVPLMSFVNNANFGYSVTNVGDVDGDGVTDLAVGAPGSYVGSVFILFLTRNGTVKGSPVLIREGHGGGPPQSYQGRFGSTVAGVGDWDGDGVPDLAVTAGDAAAGSSKMYVMIMRKNGTVKSYSTIGFGLGGGPAFENQYSNFGHTITVLGDLDKDNVTDLAIGARFNTDPGGEESSGAFYICFMNRNGTIKSFVKHGDVLGDPRMPATHGDECGGGLANIGDLNHDQYSQIEPYHTPPIPSGYPSLPDLVIGCPQGRTGYEGGRIMLGFLRGNPTKQTATGHIDTYR
jgi:hypothetical protein